MQSLKKSLTLSPVLKFIGIYLSLIVFRSVSIFKKSYREGCLSVTSNYNQIPFSPCNYTQFAERRIFLLLCGTCGCPIRPDGEVGWPLCFTPLKAAVTFQNPFPLLLSWTQCCQLNNFCLPCSQEQRQLWLITSMRSAVESAFWEVSSKENMRPFLISSCCLPQGCGGSDSFLGP